VLGCGVTGNGDDTYVKKVDEEFVRSDFLGFFCAPEKAFVEILSYYGLLVEPDVVSVVTTCLPCFFVERRFSKGVCRVCSIYIVLSAEMG
jgi:hypothetical protein